MKSEKVTKITKNKSASEAIIRLVIYLKISNPSRLHCLSDF